MTRDGVAVGAPAPVDPVTGEATVTVAAVAAGTHRIAARFAGAGDLLPSSTAGIDVVVLSEGEGFVARGFDAVLGRPGDEAGIQYWADVLGSGRSLAAVADALARSAEGRGRVVSVLYQQALGREASAADRDYWAGRLARDLTPEDLLVTLLGSAEVRSTGAPGPADFVAVLYAQVLGRDAGPGDLDYWAGRLTSDTEKDRRSLARAFVRTPEATAVAVHRATVAACPAGTPVPTDPTFAEQYVATGGDPVRLVGHLLALHCPTP